MTATPQFQIETISLIGELCPIYTGRRVEQRDFICYRCKWAEIGE